jgi:cytoskeleton protein RodZ
VPSAAQPAPEAANARPGAAAPQFGSGLLNAPQPAAGAAALDNRPSTAGAVAGAAATGAVGPAAPASSAATDSAAAGRSQPAISAAPAPSGSIDIRALADSWVQIRDADQEIVFARVLKTGETYRVPKSGLILRTGNAGALEVLVDGKPAPALGALGTLRRNVTLEPDALRAGTAVRG